MKIDVTFSAVMERVDTKGGWTYVIWPASINFFGTKGTVKVSGSIDGKPFRGTFMAMGGGRQMLPINAATRQMIGKDVGDSVTIVLRERL